MASSVFLPLTCIIHVFSSIFTTISQKPASEPFDLCQRVSWHGTSSPVRHCGNKSIETTSKPSEQCSKHLLVDYYMGTIILLYCAMYWGVLTIHGKSYQPARLCKMFDSGLGSLRTSEVSKSPGENAQELQNLRSLLYNLYK